MRHYELVTIISPILNQDQSIEAWDRIKSFITDRDAEIVREQQWGTRRLAYPIHRGAHHFLEGTYYLTQFSTERPFNQELETFLRLDERVLRSLVIATGPPAPEPEPAPVVEPVVEESAEGTTEEAPVAEAAAVEEVSAETVVVATEEESAPEAAAEEESTPEAAVETEEAPASEAEPVAEASADEPASEESEAPSEGGAEEEETQG